MKGFLIIVAVIVALAAYYNHVNRPAPFWLQFGCSAMVNSGKSLSQSDCLYQAPQAGLY